MTTIEKILIAGVVAALTLLFTGCAGAGYYNTGDPYFGDFGPYYPYSGPFYDGDFIIEGTHYRNYAGGHHFYGRSFGSGHAGGFHGGGHGGGHR